MRRMRVWLARAALASTLAFSAFAAGAESLVSVDAGQLPQLSAVPQQLMPLDDSLVAFAADGSWLLAADAKGWNKTAWSPPAPVRGVAGDARHAYLLVGNAATEQVMALTLAGTQISATSLPPLPLALTDARGTLLGGHLYLAGISGARPQLWRIAVASADAQWQAAAAWPQAGTPAALIGQGGALYAVLRNASGADRLLRWNADSGWVERPALPGRIVAGSARALGQAHLLFLVQTEQQASPRLMSYHTITSAWAALPDTPTAGAIAAASWKNGIVWQLAAGAGHSTFAYAQPQSGKLLLRWLDWIVIVVYLAAMVGMGLYFYLREKRNSTSDFFVGGRRIPFWAAGLSLYAANTSSISFIAIPAKSFETNWQYLTNNLIAVMGLMFVGAYIVPLLRRLDLMSVFSYLETRFHPAIRMFASALCIVMQIGSRMSVILFLPALAIATITGIDVVWSVLIMGGFTIVYTAMGGMKAVIWTDVVQVIVKMGGAVFAIGFIVWHLKGGFGEFAAIAAADDKTHLLDFSFDLTKATVWGFVFLVVFDVVLTFPKDQVLMQRTLSTKSDKEAGRSIWAFAAIMIPGGIIFYSIGTALFAYYKTHPERLDPLLPIDATFPLFIAAELPMGVTGMIIAGIFAAAMATLSSIMNSVATLASVDFYEKLAKNPTPKKSVLFAEVATVATGLIGIAVALILSRFDIRSLFDVSIELAGLLGGGFAGAYTLGMFTRRANSPGVAIGVAASIALTLVAWWLRLVHPYFYLAISIMLCIVIGYVASLFFPPPTRSLDGLTIYRDSDSRNNS